MPNSAAVWAPEDTTLDQVARDEEGFLLDANDWHAGLIAPLAAEAGLELTPERLEVVRYVRTYFEENEFEEGNERRDVTSISCSRTATVSRPARLPACANHES